MFSMNLESLLSRGNCIGFMDSTASKAASVHPIQNSGSRFLTHFTIWLWVKTPVG